MKILERRFLLGYSLLALPLAMAALPVYVHVPKFYADTLGVPLAWVGVILLAARLFDALQDPLLGYLSDRTEASRYGRGTLILIGVPLLAIGFIALFHPPAAGSVAVSIWLGLSLMIVYLGFSAASVSYLAIGAELSADYHERTRVTATRAGAGVVGVLIAALLPELLGHRLGTQAGLARFSELYVPLLVVCALVTLLTLVPRHGHRAPGRDWRSMFAPLSNGRFRWLIVISIASGVAGAIPGTLILFFVADVLKSQQYAGLFLGLYFLFGAAGMPVWVAAARRFGKKRAWLAGMLMATVAFIWAFSLGPGDVAAFAVVCALSGIAYGAELALPPSLLADLVDHDARPGAGRPDGAYFGVWQMVEKLNLALAAGTTLPLLALLGYVPGEPQRAFGALSAIYALLPCAIKLAGAALLWCAPLDSDRRVPGALARQGGMG